MRYEQTSRELLMGTIPHTIAYLESFDQMIANGIELVIRDTDHMHASLRLEFRNSNGFPFEIYKQICDYAASHCCICGSTYKLQIANDKLGYDLWWTYGDPPFVPYVCMNCYERLYRMKMPYNKFVELQIHRQSTELDYKAWHIKLRLQTMEGQVLYRFADDVLITNGHYVIKDKRNPTNHEIVNLIGIDTGLRDINDERIFSGDILIMEIENAYGRNRCITHIEASPSRNNNTIWCLYPRDGNGNVPFEVATRVKIIGHLLAFSSFDKWCDENAHIDVYSIKL